MASGSPSRHSHRALSLLRVFVFIAIPGLIFFAAKQEGATVDQAGLNSIHAASASNDVEIPAATSTDTVRAHFAPKEEAEEKVPDLEKRYAFDVNSALNDSANNGHFRLALPPRSFPTASYQGKIIQHSAKNETIRYTFNPDLQRYVDSLVKELRAPHVAAVVLEPRTGKILALSEHSANIDHPALHAGFPAASLFKLVTTAAAIEEDSFEPSSPIHFRGGTYTLSPANYLPDGRRDTRKMSLGEALGKSCNPVFARVALQHLSPRSLADYAHAFGFNSPLPFDVTLPVSSAQIPSDRFQFTRSAAGFGDVFISPVHAAAIAGGIANGGNMLQPTLIDSIEGPEGKILYRSEPRPWRKMVSPMTARELLDLMQYTTTEGTSKREFFVNNRPVLGNIAVAGKTGTLRGDHPKGINNWFVGAAPIAKPEIAVAVVVVYPNGISTRASRVARQIFQKFFALKKA